MVENISSVLSADSISTLLAAAAAALAPSSQEEEKFDVVLVLSVCHRVMGRWTLKMIGGALHNKCYCYEAMAAAGA